MADVPPFDEPHDRRLRIALLTETYAPVIGGGETQARLLAEGLAERGHQVAVITRRTHRAHVPRERIGGVVVRRLGPVGRHHLWKWALAATVPAATTRLLRGADVVFVSGFRVLGIPARLVTATGGVPVVLKSDNNGELSGAFFTRGLARFGISANAPVVRAAVGARNRLLRGAAAWVALSADIASEYRALGVPAAAIHRIPNGFDPARFRPASGATRATLRQRLGLPAERRIVTYTGRLVTYKGLPTLLRAWRPIADGYPDALLLLVGEGGLDVHACEPDLRRYVGEAGLAHSVQFTGPVQNVEDYLRASDGFVLPSEQEAFGLSLVEAMACGLPCVATPVGGMREILRHESTGFVVRVADEAALREALARLVEGGEGVAAIGRRAAEDAAERYGGPSVVRAYESLFRSVSGS